MPNSPRHNSGVWVHPVYIGLFLEHELSMKPVEVGKVDFLNVAEMG